MMPIEPSFPDPVTRPIPFIRLDDPAEGDWLTPYQARAIERHAKRQAAKGNGFRAQWIVEGKPAPTFSKNYSCWGSNGTILLNDRGRVRLPSANEHRVAASYPLAFRFAGTKAQQWARIGNSVPPFFARAVAQHVRSLLSWHDSSPQSNPTVAMSNPQDYVAALEAAWAAHLAPRAPDAPTVVSLFAGCGGSSLGYSMAGYRELLAVEWDDNAVATFRLNFPSVPVYHGNIAKLSVEHCLELAGIAPGQLDVLDGSPPCQGFSMAGKRSLDDPRNGLFREYVRLLRGLRPRAFVMENVSGLVRGKMKLVFAEILRELKASGYRVRARLLNAMYFGVPQSRERLIFVGIRDDLEADPGHPRPVATVDLQSALADVRNESFPPGDFRPLFAAVRPGKTIIQCCNKTLIERYIPRLVRNRTYSFVNYGRRQRWDGPSQTIVKTFCPLTPIHPAEDRNFTLEEAKRIGSFPDRFATTGSFESRWARIGNAVPPLFMRAVAAHVRSVFRPVTLPLLLAE